MRRRWWTALALGTLVVALGGCADGATQDDRPAPPPSPPTRWTMTYTVAESADLQVEGRRIDAYGESTNVLVPGADPGACTLSVAVPGWGGPDQMVGEKVAERVQGHPGFRNGAGAEGSYLMWKVDSGPWVSVVCDGLHNTASVDVVVAAVRATKTPIRLPFGLPGPPDGYFFLAAHQGLTAPSARVTLGRLADGHANPAVEITWQPDRPAPVRGERVMINDRQALIDSEPSSPSVCLSVQSQWVCLRPPASDTHVQYRPPVTVDALQAMAATLYFADDLGDPSTWFEADRALGP